MKYLFFIIVLSTLSFAQSNKLVRERQFYDSVSVLDDRIDSVITAGVYIQQGETELKLITSDGEFRNLALGHLGVFGEVNLFKTNTIEGSWRMKINGDSLLIQRYESGSWITKQTFQ